MALSASTLSGLIRTALAPTADGTGNASHAVDNAQLTALCDAIAGAVVTHLKAAAVVTVPSGVAVATAGSATAQVGATTAPGIGAIT